MFVIYLAYTVRCEETRLTVVQITCVKASQGFDWNQGLSLSPFRGSRE